MKLPHHKCIWLQKANYLRQLRILARLSRKGHFNRKLLRIRLNLTFHAPSRLLTTLVNYLYRGKTNWSRKFRQLDEFLRVIGDSLAWNSSKIKLKKTHLPAKIRTLKIKREARIIILFNVKRPLKKGKLVWNSIKMWLKC